MKSVYRMISVLLVATAAIGGGITGTLAYQKKHDANDPLPVISRTESGTTNELAIPEFSAPSGFYDAPFSLKLSTETRGAEIHYTLDGSTPDASSPAYAQPLQIENRSSEDNLLSVIPDIAMTEAGTEFVPEEKVAKGTVVKAVTVDCLGNVSDVSTHSYFVGLSYGDVAVVSLSTDAANFFQNETGIYRLGEAYQTWMETDPDASNAEVWEVEGNFSQKGKAWERPVTFELLEPDGTIFSQQLGIRIMGTATRTYYQKSFRLFARSEYGKKKVKYPLLPENRGADGEVLEKYDTFVLRNGGNDCDYTKFRDNLIQEIFADRSLTTLAARPAVVFLNGEYWGVYALQEDCTADYLEAHTGIPAEDLILVKTGELEHGADSDQDIFDAMWENALETDFSVPANYQRFCEQVDIQSLMDLYSITLLTANEDGILNDNNWRCWRSRSASTKPQQDGKWRFMLYGTEFALGLYTGDSTLDQLRTVLQDPEADGSKLLQKLLANPDFKRAFVNTCADLLNVNFATENTTALLDQYKNRYTPLMSDQFTRFGPDWVVRTNKPYDEYFAKQVKSIRTFLSQRPALVYDMLEERLQLAEAGKLTLHTNTPDGGKLTVNTITPTLTENSWSATYFPDAPITVTATPAPGYTFTGWSGASGAKTASVTLTVTGVTELTANFEKTE